MRLRLRRRVRHGVLSEQEAADLQRAREIAGRIVTPGRGSVLALFAETGTIADLALAAQEIEIAVMFGGDPQEIADVGWLTDWLDALARHVGYTS